jgi:hypothetical protein
LKFLDVESVRKFSWYNFYNGSGIFKQKKVLITGGNGYLAYDFIDALKNTELEITRFDLKIDNWSDFGENCNIKIN